MNSHVQQSLSSVGTIVSVPCSQLTLLQFAYLLFSVVLLFSIFFRADPIPTTNVSFQIEQRLFLMYTIHVELKHRPAPQFVFVFYAVHALHSICILWSANDKRYNGVARSSRREKVFSLSIFKQHFKSFSHPFTGFFLLWYLRHSDAPKMWMCADTMASYFTIDDAEFALASINNIINKMNKKYKVLFLRGCVGSEREANKSPSELV